MKKNNSEISTEKTKGKVYTPDFVVQIILDLSDYQGAQILKKHVIDNSCGDGAFLIAVVDRYCKQFLLCNSDIDDLKKDLTCFVHGIEIDENEVDKCKKNLDYEARKYNIENVCWDIRCANALYVKDYDGKMDFVVGNPPYVRVHNLGESFLTIKNFSFAQNGMTDLFIVFYEIGLKMLNKNGTLGYITPSSFFSSVAGKYMRNYFMRYNLIDKVVDLKHYQAFSSTTYTSIVILKKNKSNSDVKYYQFDGKNNIPYFVDTLTANDYMISANFYFATKTQLEDLKRILSFKPIVEYFNVKNGFATLADDIFIGEFDFSEYVIPVVKASTGKWSKCFFPYRNGKLIPYEELISIPKIKCFLEEHRSLLLKRSLENTADWYGFGRTQGIKDVEINKFVINTLVRDISDIKLTKCEKGTGVYGGVYIVTKINEQQLRNLLLCEDFISYVASLGKYKSGGYYTFSSKDLKLYLEYKFSQRNAIQNEQLSIFSYT